MSIKDKLEIGLKPDAPYRPDNLPDHQQGDEACEKGAEPGSAPDTKQAREDCDGPPKEAPAPPPKRKVPVS